MRNLFIKRQRQSIHQAPSAAEDHARRGAQAKCSSPLDVVVMFQLLSTMLYAKKKCTYLPALFDCWMHTL